MVVYTASSEIKGAPNAEVNTHFSRSSCPGCSKQQLWLMSIFEAYLEAKARGWPRF